MLSRKILRLSLIPIVGMFYLFQYENEFRYENKFISRYIYQFVFCFSLGFFITFLL